MIVVSSMTRLYDVQQRKGRLMHFFDERCAHDTMVQVDLRFLFVQMVGKDRFARDRKG